MIIVCKSQFVFVLFKKILFLVAKCLFVSFAFIYDEIIIIIKSLYAIYMTYNLQGFFLY